MAKAGFLFDEDCKKLVELLLQKHAKANADYKRYDGNIGEQMQFEIANRALRAMGLVTVAANPPPETKK